MAATDRAQNPDSVDRAINQVLAAEREARNAVECCRAEAAQILAAAEEGVRRVARRTERRVKLAHCIADHAVERSLAELHGPKLRSGLSFSDADFRELLDRAVEALVEEVLAGRP